MNDFQSNPNHIKVGVGVIIIEDGKTLLTQRIGKLGGGSYGSLGGHVEFGESLVEALQREAMEELGISLKDIEFLVCSNIRKYDKHYIDISFTAKIETGEPKIMEPDKIASLGWYPLDDLPSPLFEPVVTALDALRTKQKYFEIH
jgi:8-oxo-dGTP diphosphatase